MSINPETRYGGQINTATDDYPQGSAVNVSSPSADDGTPLFEDWLNDLWGFNYKMLRGIGITPNNVIDTTKVSQFFAALAQIAQAGQNPIIMENDGVSPTDKLKVKAGVAWDSTKTVPIALLADIVKDITLPWAADDGNGGYGSASPLAVGTWYHVFLIKEEVPTSFSQLVDVGFDADINATALLAASGYTYFKRIGSIYFDTGNLIRLFKQVDNRIVWIAPLKTLVPVITPGAFIAQVLLTPPGIITAADVSLEGDDATGSIAIVIKPTFATAGVEIAHASVTPADFDARSGYCNIVTNTSSEIDITSDALLFTSGLFVQTLGWREISQ